MIVTVVAVAEVAGNYLTLERSIFVVPEPSPLYQSHSHWGNGEVVEA